MSGSSIEKASGETEHVQILKLVKSKCVPCFEIAGLRTMTINTFLNPDSVTGIRLRVVYMLHVAPNGLIASVTIICAVSA